MNKILERQYIAQEIRTILQDFDTNCKNIQFKKGIYIYGSPGSGKTHFVVELLKELNYDIIKYDAGDVRNKTLIETITSNNVASRNVLHMMARKVKKIAIVMDEIDGMNNGDKGGITSLIKLIRQKKTKKQRQESMTMNPIICIGNYYMDKKIKELMKVCNTFELKTPNNEQIASLLAQSMPELPEQTYSKMIDYVQGDLRKYDFIKLIYEKNRGILLDEETMTNIFHVKSYNDDSKKITQKLIEKPANIREHTKIMNETDRTIVALLWHENIVDAISKYENSRSIPFYFRILENMCFADFMDRITFQNQIWQFNEMSSLIKTFYNNKLYHETFTNHEPKDDSKDEPIKSTSNTDIRFTKVLTKYSTEYNNILFVYHLCQQMNIDKKDLIAFFQELRLFYGGLDVLLQPDTLNAVEHMFENTEIDKLDIRRMYRYLEKNVKKDCSLIEDDFDDESEDGNLDTEIN
jgi:DNA polymerase III delta prime subunit